MKDSKKWVVDGGEPIRGSPPLSPSPPICLFALALRATHSVRATVLPTGMTSSCPPQRSHTQVGPLGGDSFLQKGRGRTNSSFLTSGLFSVSLEVQICKLLGFCRFFTALKSVHFCLALDLSNALKPTLSGDQSRDRLPPTKVGLELEVN